MTARKVHSISIVYIAFCMLYACDAPRGSIAHYTYTVRAVYNHDPQAFTQGLQYVDGTLFESTGRYGQSTLREVALESGDIIRKVSLANYFFGEGMTVIDATIYQLTWQSGICLVYDRETFEEQARFIYDTVGWGLTDNGTHLIMSDGSNRLYYRDPGTFAITRTVSVTLRGAPLTQLNELEYINGTIFANIWQTDLIALIDPASGKVTGLADLTGLLESYAATHGTNVLNGIAYNSETGRLLVTGKLWPNLFEIELIEQTISSGQNPHL